MSRDNYNKLSNDELDFVDDKTAALLLNTPNSARLMLWVMVLFFCCSHWLGIVGTDRPSHRRSR